MVKDKVYNYSFEFEGKLVKNRVKKITCPKCGGVGDSIETYPKSPCSECGGEGNIIVDI